MCRRYVASSVHVQNRRAASAWRPGEDPGSRLKVKSATVMSLESNLIVDMLSAVASEGERIGTLAVHACGNLGKANHVGLDDGESGTSNTGTSCCHAA